LKYRSHELDILHIEDCHHELDILHLKNTAICLLICVLKVATMELIFSVSRTTS
jgi:hypothetical protein